MKIYKTEYNTKITEVGENIFCIELPQPFYSPNNIYLIKDKEPALIDAGFILHLGLLQRSLQTLGLSLKKIQHIFFTHNHIDHISSALLLKNYTKAKFYGMRGMTDETGDFIKALQEFQRAEVRLIYKALKDPNLRKQKVHELYDGWEEFKEAYLKSTKLDPLFQMDAELVEGDVISVGQREIGFLHTPGHNKWHLIPYILGEGIYFTGDVVLENISSIYSEVDGNLQDYHLTLERLLKLPIQRILPSHGTEPKNPQKAIRLLYKTLGLLEKSIIRKLKEGNELDLNQLAIASMGEKVQLSPYYRVALAIVHSIILKLIQKQTVLVNEVDPPYERYFWKETESNLVLS